MSASRMCICEHESREHSLFNGLHGAGMCCAYNCECEQFEEFVPSGPPAPQGSGEHKLVADNAELRKQLAEALTLGAEQVLEIQELRQVVKKYRLEHKVVYGCKDGELCGTCASAELLEPKPTQQGDKE